MALAIGEQGGKHHQHGEIVVDQRPSASEKPWSIMRRTAVGSDSVVTAARTSRNAGADDKALVAHQVGANSRQRAEGLAFAFAGCARPYQSCCFHPVFWPGLPGWNSSCAGLELLAVGDV
jgi:hypothetical protein